MNVDSIVCDGLQTTAHIARVYDFFLGGEDDFPADRAGDPCRLRGHDPIVLAHARVLMADQNHGRTVFIDADARDPAKLLLEPPWPRSSMSPGPWRSS